MNLVKSFGPMRSLKMIALATAASATALVGGGALLRNNSAHEPTKEELIMQMMCQSDNAVLPEVKNLQEALDEFKKPQVNYQTQLYRYCRDLKINEEKNQDLKVATNDVERAAIKAYALTRLTANHIDDKLSDMFD